jgi:hypothetical protein
VMPLKILVEYYAVSTGKAADVSKCRQRYQSTRRNISEDLNPQQHSLLNVNAEHRLSCELQYYKLAGKLRA